LLQSKSLLRLKCSAIYFLLLISLFALATPAQDAPPAHLTSEQDHQRLMDLLGIKELRRGPDGDPKSPNAANVDESRVLPYTLPDPLRFNNGDTAKTSDDWVEKAKT